jgi:hypothetical protein
VLRNGIGFVHEAFADYLLVNPGSTLRAMGAYFNYSPSWICTVIKSDMFKAYFAKRRSGVEAAIMSDLPAKLAAAAELATERVTEILQTSSDPELVLDAFDKVLHRTGYAPSAKHLPQGQIVNNTQNNFYLSKDELTQAREKLITSHAPREEAKGDAPALPAPT